MAVVLDVEIVKRALDLPAIKLLTAYSAWWVLPLFSEHLETAGGPVSAEWFHQKVADVLEEYGEQIPGSGSPADHCKKWVDQDRWLTRSRSRDDGRLQYELTDSALRALRIVRDLVNAGSTVSEARLGSIADAVRRLADLTNPDLVAQLARIDIQIADLQARRQDIEAGQVRPATTEEMSRQFAEVMGLVASLPADFRRLSAMVEQRHHAVTAAVSTNQIGKGAMVEQFLHENDLLAQTPEGRAYRGFSDVLVSERAEAIRRDIDQVLAQDFARTALTERDRLALRSLMATLLAEEHTVQAAYTKWTGSLRRFLTRSAGGRHQRLLTLVEQALDAGRALCAARPGRVAIPEVLGIGPLAIRDISQTQLWQPRAEGPLTPIETVEAARLSDEDREALLTQAGTSTKAVAVTISSLLHAGGRVTTADVFAATPDRSQRLIVLLAVMDLGIAHGHLDDTHTQDITLITPLGARRRVRVPLVTFTRPIPRRHLSRRTA